jgi:nickel-dependent lactate racemase
VPGDRVVLAIDHNVPQLPQVIAPLVETLLACKVDPEDVTLLWTKEASESGALDPRSLLPARVREAITLSVHDPVNREQLGYLAATADGDPIYLNRCLIEADVVLPVAVAKSSDRLTADKPSRHLYPTFSDADAGRRLASKAMRSGNGPAAGAEPVADEVAWLLGVLFAVEVVPGPGDSVLDVLAGELEAVARKSDRAWQSAWRFSVPRPADLVVVTLEGSKAHHTWERFAHALRVATAVAADDAAIVVCTELATLPGEALRRADNVTDGEELLEELQDSAEVDFEAAAELTAALERARVYLISRLEDEVVEELGMTPLAGTESIERLAQWAESCILISNAQHATAVVEDE